MNDFIDSEQYIIKPHPKLKEFFEVLVFRKHSEMTRFLRSVIPNCPEYRACILWPKHKKNTKLGIITFCREWLDLDSISHECFHASLSFFRNKDIHYDVNCFNREKEELLCSMQQYLVAQLLRKVPDIKVKKNRDFKKEFLNSMKFYKFNKVLLAKNKK